MQPKSVIALHPAQRDDIGDLITRRPLPNARLPYLDPFLFLNHHGPQVYPPNNNGLPFTPHPHRGFETVTFILSGQLLHRDSAGHENVVTEGGVQWMTAGRGVVHAEVSPPAFLRRGGALEILQLWVNLPARLKMCEPNYDGKPRVAIPAIPIADGKAVLNLISGAWEGEQGSIPSLTGVFMSTIAALQGARMVFPGLGGRNVFLYVVAGQVKVNGKLAPHFNLVQLSVDGDVIGLEVVEDCVLLFGHGQPINEPVFAHGPFVMNTREEIETAYADLRAGRFEG